MPPEFNLISEPIDDTRQVVAVAGEIDLFTAPELKAALARPSSRGARGSSSTSPTRRSSTPRRSAS